jgi:cell wall-associated NlpC family hydrolase
MRKSLSGIIQVTLNKRDLDMKSFKKSLVQLRKFFKTNLPASITFLILCLNSSHAVAVTTKHSVRHRHHTLHRLAHHSRPAVKHRYTQHKRKSVHRPETTVSDDSPALFAAAVPAYYNKPDYVIPTHATVSQKHLVNFVDKTVSTLHYSDYKMGGTKFDPLHGVYVLDCSNFVDHILQTASPLAYSKLVSATGTGAPSTQHYYDFFKDLNSEPTDFWNKVTSVEQLRPGDILVFRNKHSRGRNFGGGHVMVVMDTPTHNTNVFFVRVADSAPSRHSQDTRQIHEGGIGIGTLLLKVNPITGLPNAYAWGMGGFWNKNVNFAMGRPLDTSDITGV